MRPYLLAILCAFLASCATTPKPPVAIPVAEPVKSVAVSPLVAPVSNSVAKATTSAKATQETVKDAQENVDGLIEQGTANKAELTAVKKILINAQRSISDLGKSLSSATAEVATLQTAAVDRDREVNELRRDRTNMDSQLRQATNTQAVLQRENTKLAKKAAVYDFFKTWILWILAIVLVGAILRFAIHFAAKSLKPI